MAEGDATIEDTMKAKLQNVIKIHNSLRKTVKILTDKKKRLEKRKIEARAHEEVLQLKTKELAEINSRIEQIDQDTKLLAEHLQPTGELNHLANALRTANSSKSLLKRQLAEFKKAQLFWQKIFTKKFSEAQRESWEKRTRMQMKILQNSNKLETALESTLEKIENINDEIDELYDEKTDLLEDIADIEKLEKELVQEEAIQRKIYTSKAFNALDRIFIEQGKQREAQRQKRMKSRKELKPYRSEIKLLERECAQCSEKHEFLSDKIMEIGDELKETEDVFRRYKAKLNDRLKGNTFEDLRRVIAQNKRLVAEKTEDVESLIQSIAYEKGRKQQLEKKIKPFELKSPRLNLFVRRYEFKRANALKKKQEPQEIHSNLSKTVVQKLNECKTTGERLQELKKEVAQLKEQIEEHNYHVRDHITKHEELIPVIEENSKIKNQGDAIESSIKLIESEINDLRQKVEKTEHNVKFQKSNIIMVKKQHGKQQILVKQFSKELNAVKKMEIDEVEFQTVINEVENRMDEDTKDERDLIMKRQLKGFHDRQKKLSEQQRLAKQIFLEHSQASKEELMYEKIVDAIQNENENIPEALIELLEEFNIDRKIMEFQLKKIDKLSHDTLMMSLE